MGCQVTVLADSVAPNGSRLITMEVEHWRAIHAEVLRHRSFSFSAASSRAIPGGRMIDYVEANPAGPVAWTTAKKGMQGGSPLPAEDVGDVEQAWRWAREDAIEGAELLDRHKVHKSISNRLLEPFAHIRCVITGSADAWANFWDLRLHWDAEPSIQQLAKMTALAAKASKPKALIGNQWHLPYITDAERLAVHAAEPEYPADVEMELAKLSAARCARVSYKTHDGKTPTREDDLALFEKLVGGTPKHSSPLEHQAAAYDWPQGYYIPATKGEPWKFNGNLGPGWVQHRKLIPGERATAETFDLDARMRLYEGVDYLLEDPTR